MRILTDAQIRGIATPLGGKRSVRRWWKEGVNLIGYWPTGDSFVFEQDEICFCISKRYLKEILT